MFQREWISGLETFSFIIDKIYGDWLSTPWDHGPLIGFSKEKKYADIYFLRNEQFHQVLLSTI